MKLSRLQLNLVLAALTRDIGRVSAERQELHDSDRDSDELRQHLSDLILVRVKFERLAKKADLTKQHRGLG